jgi:hypothetical protein
MDLEIVTEFSLEDLGCKRVEGHANKHCHEEGFGHYVDGGQDVHKDWFFCRREIIIEGLNY